MEGIRESNMLGNDPKTLYNENKSSLGNILASIKFWS